MKKRPTRATIAAVAVLALAATACGTSEPADEAAPVVDTTTTTTPQTTGTVPTTEASEPATTAATKRTVVAAATPPTARPRTSGSPSLPYAGEIGVTPDTVTIGALTVDSGPYAAISKSVEPGIRAAIASINADGGIHGRELRLRTEDGTFDDASAAVAAAKEMEDDVFGMLAQGSTASIAVSPYADQGRFPFLAGITTRKTNIGLRYAFPASTYHVDMAGIVPSFIVNHLKDDGKHVGILYQQLPQANEVRQTLKEKGKEHGLVVVSEAEIGNNPGPCTNQISKLQADGATLVVLFVGPPQAIQCLRDAGNAFFDPTWTGIGPTFDFQVTANASGGATSGMRLISHRRTMESPEGQRFLAAMQRAYPNRPDVHDDIGFWAWGLTHMFAAGIEGAGRDLTREGWVEAMEQLNGWDGGYYPPIDFGPRDRSGPGKTIVIEGQGSGFVTVDSTWRSGY